MCNFKVFISHFKGACVYILHCVTGQYFFTPTHLKFLLTAQQKWTLYSSSVFNPPTLRNYCSNMFCVYR